MREGEVQRTDLAEEAIARMNGFQIGDKRLKVQHKRVRAAGAAALAAAGVGIGTGMGTGGGPMMSASADDGAAVEGLTRKFDGLRT